MSKQLLSGLLLLFISTCSFSGIVKSNTDSLSAFQKECKAALEKLQPSLKGTTSQGNTYFVYAFKSGRSWTFVVVDSTSYYSFKTDKKTGETKENPQSVTDMICLMVKADYIKKKGKATRVADMDLNGYYKFRPKAKATYRSVNKVVKKAKMYRQIAKEGPKGLKKLLQ